MTPDFKKPITVKFYIDTGSTNTTLLSVDIVKLGIVWRGLDITTCDTAIGPTEAYVLPCTAILLKTFENKKERLIPYPIKGIHLIPPKDPLKVVPVEYEFSYSLLGMDILKNFRTWYWDFSKNELILQT